MPPVEERPAPLVPSEYEAMLSIVESENKRGLETQEAVAETETARGSGPARRRLNPNQMRFSELLVANQREVEEELNSQSGDN